MWGTVYQNIRKAIFLLSVYLCLCVCDVCVCVCVCLFVCADGLPGFALGRVQLKLALCVCPAHEGIFARVFGRKCAVNAGIFTVVSFWLLFRFFCG